MPLSGAVLQVSGGKANVVPAEVTVELDVRTLPGQGREYIMQQLRAALGNSIMDDKVDATGCSPRPSPQPAPHHDVVGGC